MPQFVRVFLLIGIMICGAAVISSHWLKNPNDDPCRRNESICIRIQGKLSQDHVEALASRVGEVEIVVVNSPGGLPTIATELSKMIFEHELIVVVDGECSSACTEFLMPAAKKVTLLPNALVAFHRNSFTIRDAIEGGGYVVPPDCPSVSFDWIAELYRKRGLSMQFHLLEEEKLGEMTFEFIVDSSGCPKITKYETEFEFWLADRDSLENFYGESIEIEGRLCRESPTCLRQRRVLNSSM